MDAASLQRVLQRYWLVAYWLLFACLAALWAGEPEWPSQLPYEPYSWTELFAVWTVLALESAVLQWLLNRRTRLGIKLCLATFYAFALCAFSASILGTDAGLLSMLEIFSLVTSLLLCAAWACYGAFTVWARFRAVP